MYWTEIVTITPDVASDMLARNYSHNRNVSNEYINQLAMIMRDGRFDSENGQTIVVGNDGVLYDGQQRLSAIVASGKTFRFIVAHIDNGAEKFKSMDRGRIRKTADFIFEKNSKDLAAAARTMACIDWGHAPLLSCIQGKILPHVKIDNSLILSYYESHSDELANAVADANRMRRAAKIGAPAAYAVFIMCMRRYGDDSMLEGFVSDFCSDTTSNPTVAKTKQAITFNVSRGNNSFKFTLAYLLAGYFHMLKGDSVKQLNKSLFALATLDSMIQKARGEEVGR